MVSSSHLYKVVTASLVRCSISTLLYLAEFDPVFLFGALIGLSMRMYVDALLHNSAYGCFACEYVSYIDLGNINICLNCAPCFCCNNLVGMSFFPCPILVGSMFCNLC